MKVKLGNLTKIRTGRLDANAASPDGKYPFFTCSRETLRIDSYAYDCECVLVGGNGGLNVKYYNGKFDAYQRTYIIEDNGSGILHIPYLYYFLKSYVEGLRSLSNGGVIRYIRLEDLTGAYLELPDIESQKTIAGLLMRAEKLVDARRRELQKLELLIKARFAEMFGTPFGNEKGFPMKTAGDVIEFIGGAQPEKKYFQYAPSEDNVRLIQIRDYKTDEYITYIPRPAARRTCDADDIMIGRYGPPVFQILQGIEGAYNVALMKAVPRMGNKEFIRWFLKQDQLSDHMTGLSQRTSGQSGVDLPALKAFPFPYPPIGLQDEFERFVKKVGRSEASVQAALDRAQMLAESLTQKYFG